MQQKLANFFRSAAILGVLNCLCVINLNCANEFKSRHYQSSTVSTLFFEVTYVGLLTT